ncbi:MAG: 4-hydroxy-3-methylbut-2-enyl diphosphate reductase [Chitinophagaceae bacterium]|nr:4-hydroxy-3-methylbut-2-enyl diphosphate reductase [Chitinophagaceae bacterium]
MKTFEVPAFYRSPLLSKIKNIRKENDKLKKDFQPTCLDFGVVQFFLARHFGFCYGVENAIEIAFRTVQENPTKRIFLLSEMIHNPKVNADLLANGVQFIMDTKGNMINSWDSITEEDIVIIPAFGTTLETEELLRAKGIDPLLYNTTCPFVERVWKKADQIAKEEYTIIIHGKPSHEETKATFSHSSANTPSLIINDLQEAKLLAKYITNQLPTEQFYIDFAGKYSKDFDASKHLSRVGVVNQTTMLAEDTQAIAEFIKQTIAAHYNLTATTIAERFADTRDTLCYATNDNQTAVKGMLQQQADLAIVVGGYNSSNTSHLVELCEEVLPTYFINDANNIIDKNTIIRHHFRTHEMETVSNFLPTTSPIKILITSGASCPDAVIENVIDKLLSLLPEAKTKGAVMNELN